jgi:hypothetical protein
MLRFEPGTEPTFFVAFVDDDLNPKDPDSLNVDVLDPFGNLFVTGDDPHRDSTGNYSYTVTLPADASEGIWTVRWNAVRDMHLAQGEEQFEVAVDVNAPPNALDMHAPLRSRLGEISSLPAEQNGSDTLFPTAEISEILALTTYDLDRATLEGWERKAGKLSGLINIAESGTQRELSRKFDQARKMVDHWAKTVSVTAEIRRGALAGRVVGKPMNLRDRNSAMFVVGMQPNAYTQTRMASYDRYYPTKRLLVPLGVG